MAEPCSISGIEISRQGHIAVIGFDDLHLFIGLDIRLLRREFGAQISGFRTAGQLVQPGKGSFRGFVRQDCFAILHFKVNILQPELHQI
ncbi:hypothetical protein D3C76_1521130 [compost metagenome]